MNLKKTTEMPLELNAEMVAAILTELTGEYVVRHEGVFTRNYKGDILNINVKNRTMSVSRDSLYHLLPQVVFHKIDLFRGITGVNHQDKFKEKWEKQKREKEIALNYFAPFDSAVFSIKSAYQSELNKWFTQNLFVAEFIFEGHDNPEDIKNPFIRQLLIFLPHARLIRGNRQKTESILRWVLGNNIKLETHCFTKQYTAGEYEGILDDSPPDAMYCGNEYPDSYFLAVVKIQQNIEKMEEIYAQEKVMEAFKTFFHRYFMPVYEELEIEIGDFEKEPVMDDASPLFLGYSTQI